MKKLSPGRLVDLSGINVIEVIEWLNSDKYTRGIIKCQAIVSLYNGNRMQDVCAVLGVTRETVRKWKQRLRQEGIAGLLNEKKAGKRTKISIEYQKELKRILKGRPAKYGYEQTKWSGKLLQDLLQKKWNISIGIRASQLWLRKLR